MKFVKNYNGTFDYKYIDVAPIDLSILASGEGDNITDEIPEEYFKYTFDDLTSEDIDRFMKIVKNTISENGDLLFTGTGYNYSDSLFAEDLDNKSDKKK